ncbi:GSCFA family protein [gut metagenome]|uniref:GSCFA family protein n=1 Tax=gut metagenome TaxID=749906 RepID=J9FZZ6_9ZZZZ
MGEHLVACKFRCDTNPYGILYNPLSIATAIGEIWSGKRYKETDLYQYAGCWHSAMHHGDFSASSSDEVLKRINDRLEKAGNEIHDLGGLLLTFGTAWVYEDRETHQVVGNCHKLPEKYFMRRKLSVEEIVSAYVSLLEMLWEKHPSLQVLFTVSPIRHIRDGFHANQLSKGTLLLAIDALQQRYPQRIGYFPAYEILMDELRDYRFFAADMVHPSDVAVEYVWEKFVQSVFSSDTQQLMKECLDIEKMLAHKPFYPNSPEYKRFLGQIVLKIDRLNRKCPYLDFEKEREICRTRLNI